MTENTKTTNAPHQNEIDDTSTDDIYLNDGTKLNPITHTETKDLSGNENTVDEILKSLTDIEYPSHTVTNNLDMYDSSIGYNLDLDSSLGGEHDFETETKNDLDISMPIIEDMIPVDVFEQSHNPLTVSDSQADICNDESEQDIEHVTKPTTNIDCHELASKPVTLTYKELQEEQSKKIQTKSKLKKSESVTEVYRDTDNEDTGLSSRLFYGVLMVFILALIGLLLDGMLMILRSVMGQGDGSMLWMFAPLLAIIGFFIGVFSGKDAGANAIDVVNVGHTVNSRVNNPSISQGILRAIGIALAIFLVGWIVLIVVT